METIPTTNQSVTLTIKQVEAIVRLSTSGWTVDLANHIKESDGLIVTTMRTSSGMLMTVGIHPQGSTHT